MIWQSVVEYIHKEVKSINERKNKCYKNKLLFCLVCSKNLQNTLENTVLQFNKNTFSDFFVSKRSCLALQLLINSNPTMTVCCVCAFIIQWYLSVVLTCGVWFTFLWDAEGTGQRDRCNGMLIHQCWKTPYQWQNTHRGPQYLAFITLQLYLPLKLMCRIAKAPECSQTATNCKHKKLFGFLI